MLWQVYLKAVLMTAFLWGGLPPLYQRNVLLMTKWPGLVEVGTVERDAMGNVVDFKARITEKGVRVFEALELSRSAAEYQELPDVGRRDDIWRRESQVCWGELGDGEPVLTRDWPRQDETAH